MNRKNLNPDVYRDIIISRRSIRQFKNEPVPRNVIEQILDLARYAPTASNDQNVGYIVITDKRLIEETAKDIFGFASRLYNKTKKGIGRILLNLTGLANNRYLKVMDYVQEQNAENGQGFYSAQCAGSDFDSRPEKSSIHIRQLQYCRDDNNQLRSCSRFGNLLNRFYDYVFTV